MRHDYITVCFVVSVSYFANSRGGELGRGLAVECRSALPGVRGRHLIERDADRDVVFVCSRRAPRRLFILPLLLARRRFIHLLIECYYDKAESQYKRAPLSRVSGWLGRSLLELPRHKLELVEE